MEPQNYIPALPPLPPSSWANNQVAEGAYWGTDEDPNGIYGGHQGDEYRDIINGRTWIKTTEGGTTGWI